MSTQLAEQHVVHALPLGEAMEQLIAAYHADDAEVEQLVKHTAAIEKENTFLKLQVNNLTTRLDDVTGQNQQLKNTVAEFEERFKALAKQKDVVLLNAEKINQRIEQEQRETTQAKNEVVDLKVQLKAYKEIANSPKKIREKIKDFQARLLKEKGITEQHKKNLVAANGEVKAFKKEIMELSHKLAVSDITQLHKNGKDYICLFPHQLGDIEGFEAGQVPLLYMHASGRSSLVLLNDDGEAELVPSPKGGLRPQKSTLEHCGQSLRRFKSQGWKLTDSDVKSIAMQN
jgi:hypothetical protein